MKEGVSDGLARVQALTTERLLLFFMLSAGAGLMLALAVFVGLPAAPLAPAKFAIPFTMGSLMNLAALAALRGVGGQLRHMAAPDRAPVSVAYVSSMLATLYATFVLHSYVLCVGASLVQLTALLYYTVRYGNSPAGCRVVRHTDALF